MAKKPKKPHKVKPNPGTKEERDSDWYIQVGGKLINAGKPKGKDIDCWSRRVIAHYKKENPDWDKPTQS